MVRLAELFERGGKRAEMAGRAVVAIMDSARVRLTCDLLASDLRSALGDRGRRCGR